MVAPRGHWDKGSLTGKKRVRRSWYGKLILQVEIEQTYWHPLNQTTGERKNTSSFPYLRKVWRDATPDDFNLNHAMLDKDQLTCNQ